MAIQLNGKAHDIGGLAVNRVLPQRAKRMVGPFIFFDQMGPGIFSIGDGIDVRPHPHIGLATLTYLFEGNLLHRDSLGNQLEIHPGDVNWMVAGRGIVHSERESFETKAQPHAIHGLQCWVALPEDYAEIDPSFSHVNRMQLPTRQLDGVMTRVIIGSAYGLHAPVPTFSPMFYVDVMAKAGSYLERPNQSQEIGIYVIYGEVEVSNTSYGSQSFILLEEDDIKLHFSKNSRVILLGGQAFSKTPYIDWNFVSFSKARIEQAKQDWRGGRFATIPEDKLEHISLP
ncbi:pirin family protein [Pseudoalteromonas sp. McH1-7]|uniref:pirin family protein n=1 Tax=Pseudoalteromonas sp. McH1-7 TaxID=2745574 RepID=UPI001591EE3D|nr:pirin family protein [Pseudoalteromonas sp. McH1-7]NUZ09206.1 pirin family protein [Pseudoalteromonas sp. McH1-7]